MTHRPPGTFLPPNTENVTADQQRRLHDLETRQVRRDPEPQFEVTATNPAPVEVGSDRQTQRWWSWRGQMRLVYVIATADGVVDGLTVDIRRGGLTVATLAWSTSGVLREGFDITWGPSQALDLTAGGSVSLLAVQLQFEGRHPGGALSFVIPADGGGGG